MKETFIQLYNTLINRPGADKLLAWLEKSDFFEAPASTRYHLSCEGGLVEHSVHVFYRLKGLFEKEFCVNNEITPEQLESIAIVALLHDVCKANYYKKSTRNVKNETTGQWEKVPFYQVDDQLPYGHGEKSQYIVSGFMRLSRNEAMAIRWHMGPWMDGEKMDAGNAFGKYPLAVLTHLADMQATYLDEKEEGGK